MRRGGQVDEIKKSVFGSWTTITIMFFHVRHLFIFSPVTKNHLISLIPTKIEQIWEIGFDWRQIWWMTWGQNSVAPKFWDGGDKRLVLLKSFRFFLKKFSNGNKNSNKKAFLLKYLINFEKIHQNRVTGTTRVLPKFILKSFCTIWILKAIIWLIPVLKRPKNKFNFSAYFSDPPSSEDPPSPLFEKHLYLRTYGRYRKIFKIKFIAWSIGDILSYVQNFAQTTPSPPILRTPKNRLFLFYIKLS